MIEVRCARFHMRRFVPLVLVFFLGYFVVFETDWTETTNECSSQSSPLLFPHRSTEDVLDPFVRYTGKMKARARKIFSLLVPEEQRSSTATETSFAPKAGKFVPICFILEGGSDPDMKFGRESPHFFSIMADRAIPFSPEKERVKGYWEHLDVKLVLVSDTTMDVTKNGVVKVTAVTFGMFPNFRFELRPSEILRTEKVEVNVTSLRNVELLPEIFKHKVYLNEGLLHGPSGAVFEDFDGINVAVAHAGRYKAQVLVQKKDEEKIGAWRKVHTFDFDRLGGENIGSIFQFGHHLYATIRSVIPASLSSRTGWGYRQTGIFRLNFTKDLRHASDTLEFEVKQDSVCAKKCGLAKDKLLTGEKVVFDADKMDMCHKNAMDQTGYLKCLPKILKGKFKNLVSDYLKCCIKCKKETEIYQAGVFNYHGRLFGAFATTKKNQVLLCSFEADFSQNCYENPVLQVSGSMGHPVISSFVHVEKKIILAASSGQVILKPKERNSDPRWCSMIFYSWKEEDFCESRKSDLVTSLVKLDKITRIGVMVKEFGMNAQVSLSIHSSKWWNRRVEFDVMEDLPGTGRKMAWFRLHEVEKCEVKFVVTSSNMAVNGLVFDA